MITNETHRSNHFTVRPAGTEEIPHIAANLREGDRLEVERFYIFPPETVLRESLASSKKAWTAFNPEGIPVAMWGVADYHDRVEGKLFGIPWLLGTDRIGESYADFLRISRRYERIMCEGYAGMFNLVDVHYPEALKWLIWLDYAIVTTTTHITGHDFFLMYKALR